MSLGRVLWRDRSPRERWMIAALGVLIGGLVYVYGLWRPVTGWRHAAAARLDDARRASFEAARARSQVTGLDRLGPLEGDVRASAAAANIRLDKIEAGDGGQVSVRLERIQLARFLVWTQALADHKAIAVVNLTAVAAGGGAVNIDAVLSRSGG